MKEEDTQKKEKKISQRKKKEKKVPEQQQRISKNSFPLCWIFAIFEDHLLDIFRIRKLSLIFYH
jgi:hypothetical protein